MRKACYLFGVQNFAGLLEPWRTQQICWCTFARCVCDLSDPAMA